MNEKTLIYFARFVSILLTPFYLPFWCLLALFLLSYMSQLPFWYKVYVLFLVYFFTVLLPSLCIRIYQKYHGWTPFQLGQRERRMIPYVISIVCYYLCLYFMHTLHIPTFMSHIVLAALLIQVVCAIINVFWKISTHTAGVGGVAGGLMAFSILYAFNPIWWLSFLFILAGLVGSSRMILRQHKLSEVIAGFFVGLFCAFFVII